MNLVGYLGYRDGDTLEFVSAVDDAKVQLSVEQKLADDHDDGDGVDRLLDGMDSQVLKQVE